MFHSFFPRPKLFLLSAILWTVICGAAWYLFAANLGPSLSLGELIGYGYPTPLPEGADEAAVAAFNGAASFATDLWLYQYMIICGAIFCAFWWWLAPHRWFRWSVVASAAILFVVWFLVQLDVMINEWFGTFYDLVQKALTTPNSVTLGEFMAQVLIFLNIAMIYVIVATGNHFVVSHFIFRWRTAMNDYYVANWQRLRGIEGASQRVQEDTMRFASTMEQLGVSLVDSFMTLIAFLPLLWGLSEHIKVLPIIGSVPQGALVVVAILWSVIGTALVAVAGIRLPGLEFRNQRVEAAYRKELVYGEDHADRARPPTLGELFANVRRNYFRIYLNYLYFNAVRISYLQLGVMVPYVALAPTIVSGAITFGIMQQVVRAFGRVESSFQYLVNSWSVIIDLISIYKRLKAFEATLDDEPLSGIEMEPVPGAAE